jgi:hypothetical protein
VADRITWYDILGIAAGASAETVQLAYQAKAKQLHSYQTGDAPAYVAQAAARGQKAIDAAWLVLGNRGQREQYDEQIGIKTKGAGLERPQPTASRPGSGLLDAAANALSGAPDAIYAAADALDSEVVLVGLGVLAGLLAAIPAPGHRADQRPVTVPDVRGVFFRACHDALTMAGFRVSTVRLTENPMPIEGLVVGQSPAPGQTVPRFSTLTVQVWHPPRQLSREQ